MKKFTENVLEAPDDELVCFCAGVSVASIRAAVAKGARTLEDIRTATGACINGDCKKNNPRGSCCSLELVEFLPKKDLLSASGCSCCGGKESGERIK